MEEVIEQLRELNEPVPVPLELPDEERAEMQKHTLIGHRILEGSDSPFLQVADAIALILRDN